MWKRYIPLIVIIIALGIVMFLLFGLDSLRREKYETALVVGDNTAWMYKAKRWTKVANNKSYEELNWKTFEVYGNNQRLGSYDLWHDDKWYVFDTNKNAINVEGLVAYRSNLDLDLVDFTKEDISSDKYIESVLDEHEIPIDSKFTTSYKTSVDIDHDGTTEDFYVISNAFPMNFQPKQVFSFVFMAKEDKIYYLYEDVLDYKVYAGCTPDIVAFIDADADNNDELVVSCFQYSNLGRIDMLYGFNGENFKILISNQ